MNPPSAFSPKRDTIEYSTERVNSCYRQSIAIVGSGAIGSYYGARLWEAGHSVKFLFRGESLKAAKEHGLRATSTVHGDMHISAEYLQAYDNTKDMGKVDWIIVALKSLSLEVVPDLILPLLSEKTRVLVVMNGLVEEDLIESLKRKTGQDDPTNANEPLRCCRALYGGMAFIGCNRPAPATVHHSCGSGISAGIASSCSKCPIDDRDAFEHLWSGSLIDACFEHCLLRGRWKKMLMNLPFNGISVAMGGITVDRITSDPALRQLVVKIMEETIAVANADMERLCGLGDFDPLGEKEGAFMMFVADGLGSYKTSTMIDFVAKRPMEVRYLFREPIDRARRLGIPVPHLETVVSQIEALQRYHDLF